MPGDIKGILTMRADTLLVTGIHREELKFGDHVAALLHPDTIDVMRIPKGIPQARTATDDRFYFNTQHREIYLQLRQQTKGRYRLLIDLHCGIDETGHCADIFCHDRRFLACLAAQPAIAEPAASVRLIKIVEPNTNTAVNSRDSIVDADAYTWIPREIWDDDHCTYVGLEVYLQQGNEGTEKDWRFAHNLIDNICTCTNDD